MTLLKESSRLLDSRAGSCSGVKTVFSKENCDIQWEISIQRCSLVYLHCIIYENNENSPNNTDQSQKLRVMRRICRRAATLLVEPN